ncbi:hypothetical protein, partial [Thalassoglobus neptunius]|uniref:hypothetical protein n=1 Tax=Thalassoglobus neptunius TaxID=1938619 RepID=UPI001E63004A
MCKSVVRSGWKSPAKVLIIQYQALFHECATAIHVRDYDHTEMPKIFHPLLALIASATESELA